ncbi:ProQ/FINO family protein, partial [Halomonas ramblicola]|uniref:ProQ/FINO family protein n=1 Tax=Halomonas ramblicola TaxID=747349 RepID=UPI0025B57E3E
PPAPVVGGREEPAPGPEAPAGEPPAASATRATAAGDEAPPATGESAAAASREAGQGDLAVGAAPSPQALLDEWYQRYGNAFFKGHTRPLMVGIHELLAEREPWPEKLVRRALACYVNLPRYLKAVREGAERIDLEGRPAGRVDAKSAEHARRKLDRLQGESRPRKARAKRDGKPRSGRQGQEERGRPQAAEPPAQPSHATLEEKLTALLAKHNDR